jgi:hypothetical protein
VDRTTTVPEQITLFRRGSDETEKAGTMQDRAERMDARSPVLSDGRQVPERHAKVIQDLPAACRKLGTSSFELGPRCHAPA